MATVKLKFRTSAGRADEGVLYFQVIHRRVVRLVNTGCRLNTAEWDAATAEIVVPPCASDERRDHLLSLRRTMAEGMGKMRRIVAGMERTGAEYTSAMVVEQYRKQADSGGFVAFSRTLVQRLRHIGRWRTADTYTTTLNSFVRFVRPAVDVRFDDMRPELMVEYEAYLKQLGICPNTTSYYMRNLRAIYNRAVDAGITEQCSPFRHVYTGIDKTVKRAVSTAVIRRIRDIDLRAWPLMDMARDVFMFSFYTRGMAFVDMAFLRKRDLSGGILSYRRRKTNQLLFIKWERQMQDIIDKYDTGNSPYMLPIIREAGSNEWRQYLSALHLVNAKLKIIGRLLGLRMPLTTYVARHGWASIARSKRVPLATISEAMGHDSENTTRIYLMSLDTSGVDRANRLVITSL